MPCLKAHDRAQFEGLYVGKPPTEGVPLPSTSNYQFEKQQTPETVASAAVPPDSGHKKPILPDFPATPEPPSIPELR